MRRPRVRWLLAAAAGLLGGAPAAPGVPAERCETIEGAPAATSESLVLGLRDQMAAGSRQGVQSFLDTGQTLFLHGGHTVEVLERHAAQGTVRVRRGPGQLPLWTIGPGIHCEASAKNAK